MVDSTRALAEELASARPAMDADEHRLAAVVAHRLFGPAFAEPARIGRFSLLERLGRGGMGVVYAAYDPVLDRRVALKLMRADISATIEGDTRDRLLREARTAARLSHPNVITVHEVGEHGDELYVAMELIDGVTLRSWLRAARTSAAIVDVFTQAGRGLAAAHGAGVVHRDFKLENVLVREVEGSAQAFVVDFGLARIGATLGERGDEGSGPISGHAGTPAYMAPERIEDGRSDALSDQYSYAVALFEALAGHHPFGAELPGATLSSILARARAHAIADEAAIPPWIRPILRRALAPAPAARYPSMDALLRELTATPERRRRRRIGAAILGLAIVSSALTVIGTSAGASPCATVEEALAGVWDPTIREDSRRAFVARGPIDGGEVWARIEPAVDAYAREWSLSRAEVCASLQGRDGSAAREVAERRDRCLDRRLAELRGLTEILREADAAAVLAATESVSRLTPIDSCDDAERLRREAVLPAAIGERALVEAMRREVARLRAQTQRPEGVAARVEPLTALARDLASPAALAEVLHLRGVVDETLGAYEPAARALEESVLAAIAGRHDRVHAEAAVMLVWIYGGQMRDNVAAERWILHADAAIRGIHGAPLLASDLLNHRGVIANLSHDYRAAEAFHREALEVRRQHLPPLHVRVLDSLTNLGLALFQQGRLPEAQELLEEALAGYRETFGPRHPRVAALLSNLGQLAIRAHDVDRGIAALEEALALKEAAFGPEHASVISTLNNLSNVHDSRGRGDLADPLMRRALAIAEREFGPESPRLAGLLHNYAYHAEALGDAEAAVSAARRSIAIQAAQLGADHPALISTHEILALAYLRGGDLDEARAAIDRALALVELAGDAAVDADRWNTWITAARIRRARGASRDEVAPLVARAAALEIETTAEGREHLDDLLAWTQDPDGDDHERAHRTR